MDEDKAITLDQIADLYELQPYQRELLALWVERGKIAKAERDSYRAYVEAEYDQISKWIEAEFRENRK